MKAFTAPMRELGEFEEISKKAAANRGLLQVTGCIDSQKSHFVYCMSEEFGEKKAESALPLKNRSAAGGAAETPPPVGRRQVAPPFKDRFAMGGAAAPVVTLIITYNDLRAKEMYENYRFFDRNILYFPAKDLIFFQADIHSNLLEQQRVQVLKALAEGRRETSCSDNRFSTSDGEQTLSPGGQKLTIITTIAACMNRMVPFEDWAAHVLEIRNQDAPQSDNRFAMGGAADGAVNGNGSGAELDTEQLKKDLIGMGYERVGQVEGPGQFAI
ncbi:MAG: hypothetical protein LUI87_00025, partial [Lachnospiraceae bacterium]|nr:hypothetical protein [Lachnospiraceae bacterium]